MSVLHDVALHRRVIDVAAWLRPTPAFSVVLLFLFFVFFTFGGAFLRMIVLFLCVRLMGYGFTVCLAVFWESIVTRRMPSWREREGRMF